MKQPDYPEHGKQHLSLLSRRFLLKPDGRLQGRHWLTLLGTAIGVFALLTVSSVMNGFAQDMQRRIVGTRAEIRIFRSDRHPITDYQLLMSRIHQSHPYLQVAPVVRNELMLLKDIAMAPTVNFGIDLPLQQKVSPALRPIDQRALMQNRDRWLQGILNTSFSPDLFEQGGIIIGSDLAQSLSVSIGDTLQLVSPLGQRFTPFGLMPLSKPLRVVGVFIAGMPEFDRLYSFVPLPVGQYFSRYDAAIDQLELRTDRPSRLVSVTKALQKEFPGYTVENWSSFDRSLYNAMHFEKYLMLVVLGFLFILAAFNMSGNIYKTIVQKRRSIGILKAIGCPDREITGIFLRQGLYLSCAGILGGLLLAFVFLWLQARFGLIRLPVGNLPSLVLPVQIKWQDALIIPLVSLAISWVSIYLPASKAGNVNIVSLLRERS